MLLLLQLKTAYFSKLPTLLCSLAHVDEEIAREGAAKVVEAWNADPREEAHHRVTRRLMKLGSGFRKGLDLFIAGTPRIQLPHDVLFNLASFRFPACVETTVEAKHARVALANRSTNLYHDM